MFVRGISTALTAMPYIGSVQAAAHTTATATATAIVTAAVTEQRLRKYTPTDTHSPNARPDGCSGSAPISGATSGVRNKMEARPQAIAPAGWGVRKQALELTWVWCQVTGVR
ncbi:hypothetical protein Vafri_11218 [Volvox africanus]|nr:hypothetical protein Vafri_11218 [Volvox africanus]